MKIVKFTAENIKKLKVVEIRPDGNLVQITGPNGSGKTSVLDAIYYALAGTGNVPSQPVRKGSGKAKVSLDLGEVVVTRKFIEGGGTTLTVEATNGARFPSPQKMLDDLLGTLTFDPLAFTRMEPRQQLETLRSLVKLELDIDEIDRQNKEDYDKRAATNKQVKNLIAMRDAIVLPQGLPDEPVDVQGMVARLSSAAEVNTAIEREKDARQRVAQSVQTMQAAAFRKREDADKLIREAIELEMTAKAAQDDLDERKPLDVPIDTSALATDIEEARQKNQWVERREIRRRYDQQIADGEKESADLTTRMKDREKQKAEAIAAADMPLMGLTFGEGEVVYNELPFTQASDAEQLRVSVAIAMAANPKLRILRIKDGSLLDENHLKVIAEMADASDYQVWIERVDTSGKVGVVMDDGEVAAVVNAKVEPPKKEGKANGAKGK